MDRHGLCRRRGVWVWGILAGSGWREERRALRPVETPFDGGEAEAHRLDTDSKVGAQGVEASVHLEFHGQGSGQPSGAWTSQASDGGAPQGLQEGVGGLGAAERERVDRDIAGLSKDDLDLRDPLSASHFGELHS